MSSTNPNKIRFKCPYEIGDNKTDTYFRRYEVANVEIRIFLNRLILIFEDLMSKLEFAATLPELLSHPEALNVLSTGDWKQISSAFFSISDEQTICSEVDSKSRLSDVKKDEEQEEEAVLITDKFSCNDFDSDTSPFRAKNMCITNAIELLFSYKSLRELSNTYQSTMSKPTVNFLRQLKLFMEYIIEDTSLTPEDDRDKLLHMRHLCSELTKTKQDIAVMAVDLEKQKEKHKEELSELFDQVSMSTETWQKIQDEFNEQLKQTLKEAEENQMKSIQNFNVKMGGNKTVMENLQKKHDTEVAASNKLIAEARAKKFKVESQLISMIMKYDTEVAERQEQHEEQMAEYQCYIDERKMLMDEMEVQLELYEAIIKEREEKEFAAYKKRYIKFVRKRCAKVIQRWWRAILKARRKKKKKGKGKKKKKK